MHYRKATGEAMYSLGRRIGENAPLLAALAIIILNIVAVLGVWHPSGATLATLNAVGAAVLVFLIQGVPSLQSWGVRRGYQVRARSEARQLVPTAGGMIGEVVGRDDLCGVLDADLRDRRARPHLLVSGEGTGKTAVLVRLTELLAEEGVVPVPIGLRDAVYELDFENLARERFFNEVNPYLVSSDEGETIWRRLRRDRKIVVLADGLEGALIGSSAEMERDNIIRAAIRRAHQQHLPLVITSRPHDPLRATDAAILVLEPLSLEAALAYLAGDGTVQDDRRIAWIVETADVVEAPLYLQITRELQVKGLLEVSSAGGVDTRGADRSRLRLALLQTWERALIGGHLYEDVPLNRAERYAAIEHMSAVACVGLKNNRLDVGFDEPIGDEVSAEVKRRLAKIDEQTGRTTGLGTVDVRLAAAWAAQLELVQLRGDGLRFPYSLIQAYLGSRLLDAALQDPGYCMEALQYPQPGWEFLIALVLHSREARRISAPPDPRYRQTDSRPRRARQANATGSQNGADGLGLLLQAAAQRDDYKVLDIYAAALEIDCVAAEPAHAAIAAQIGDKWPQIHAHDPRTLEEARLGVVRRFGEAARTIDARRSGDSCCEPAYRQLYAIGCAERSQPVQLAAAQEIAAGGAAAYQALRPVLTAPCQICESERADAHTTALRGDRFGPEGDNDSWRSWIMSAWLAPMLVGSLDAGGSGPAHEILERQAQEDLAQWLRHIGLDARRPEEEDLPISLEIALARGFKYAANRRRSPYTDDSRIGRMYLAEQALEMLKSARYWFSQLILIQALCLLNMPDDPGRLGDKYGAKPAAIVQYWIDVAGRERADRVHTLGTAAKVHPFVRESAQLAALALETGRPQRYCWIDESSIIAQVGSRNQSPGPVRFRHRLWIPPSAGWTALSGRAQQLLADVVLLLSLAERGDQPRDHERRLRRANRIDLPPCITHYRAALNPGRTVGTAISSAPGTTCVDGCVFELCPYPPKGALPTMEMSEAFCRRQQALLARNSIRNRMAPWQQMRRGQLVGFWAEMANRARGSLPR